MDSHWEILIVDDDEDVHAITLLALKNRKWRRRSFNFTSAKSAAEAREILSHTSVAHFDVAIIDVVMESKTSGLDLCEYIRAHCPPSVRIILRTGQPGNAPEHLVLSRFDIDYYLSKAEVDEAKLYSVICACLRSSLDIATLLSFGRQIRSFASVLQGVTSLRDLLLLMHEGLKFLALKYNARILFSHEVDSEAPLLLDADSLDPERNPSVFSEVQVLNALTDAHERGFRDCEVRPGPTPSSFVYPFRTSTSRGGIFVELDAAPTVERLSASFQSDLAVFVENWRLTYTTLRLQEQVAKDRMLQEKMYLERLQSIASMVAGVAHEINTPLGVASVANSMIERILVGLPRDDNNTEMLDDLHEASRLMSRNIVRAHNLIKSFKQLSSSQLSDQRAKVPISSVIEDCFLTMNPELKKAEVVPHVQVAADVDQIWNGYPGHLSQVILNFVQNVLRYAYRAGGGDIFVRIGASDQIDGFRIEFEDKGAGIPPEILPRVFDAFVTTGRNVGGTGLGLAISHNIVTNILKGTIRCASKLGDGTTFVVDIPRFVPDPPALDIEGW